MIQNEDETETQLRRYKNTATKSLNDLLISIDVDGIGNIKLTAATVDPTNI